MRKVDIVAPRLADLGAELTAGPVAFGVGCDGTVLVATCATEEPLRVERRGASFARTQLDRPARYDAPTGAPGIVAFDRFGRSKRTYDPVAAGTDPISDVYALNVAGLR